MKHLITMFLSSLILFLSLFYYWQRERGFQSQLDKIEMRVFVQGGGNKTDVMTRIANTKGVAGISEIEVPDIIKSLKERAGVEVLEGVSLPYVLSVYPASKGEVFLRNLSSELTRIEGVINVAYGEDAVKELWGEIREFRVILFAVASVLLFFYILALYLYISTLPAMRYFKVFIIYGKSLFSLRLKLIIRALIVSVVVASLSVEICYLSHLFIAGTQKGFITDYWIYYYIAFMGIIGLVMGGFKRFPISESPP